MPAAGGGAGPGGREGLDVLIEFKGLDVLIEFKGLHVAVSGGVDCRYHTSLHRERKMIEREKEENSRQIKNSHPRLPTNKIKPR